jgi:glutathione S-transferase
MKLFYAPRSPFVLKVRIILHELGLSDDVTLILTDPWNDGTLRQYNPLCKVPTLILDNGFVLYDSPVICEYLDALAEGSLFPHEPTSRFEALRLQSLGDGLAEAVIRRHVERLGPLSERAQTVIRRQEAAIEAVLNTLNADLPTTQDFNIGAVAVTAALMYLDYRTPELAWRNRRESLDKWFNEVLERPSVNASRITGTDLRA